MGTAWSRENIAWLAGLFEGEGCLHLGVGNSVQLAITMTDEDVVRRAHAVAGYGRFYHVKVDSKYKPAYRWRVSQRRIVYALCAAMHVFMGQRRRAKMEDFFSWYATGRPTATRMHGTRARYNRGCRCERCLEAAAQWRRVQKLASANQRPYP